MALITDPVAVRFCNERARPMADKLVALYKDMRVFMAEWVTQEKMKLVPASADLIDDGSVAAPTSTNFQQADGRRPITGQEVNDLANIVGGLITAIEANNNAQLDMVVKVAVQL